MGATNQPWRLNQADQSGEPRRAARRDAQLDARLSFLLPAREPSGANHDPASPTVALHTSRTLRLVGRTRNISETGLAFVVPTLRIGDEFARAIGSPLLVTLYLPSGRVEIHATPVSYEQLPPSPSERGYLIGVRVTEMADDEWVRLVKYVRTLH
ncbi:MAG: hypothetical protein QOD32_3182 [Pyrinomonadaceae bacterium]|nr:hypothetical protein [Pyrinomonadaceae bacterium]